MTKSATVVGAGVAGLSSAIALVEAGYEVAVVDRTEPPSTQIGLAITGNGLEALAVIGMRAEVERAGAGTRMGRILTDAGTALMQQTETEAGDIVGIHAETLLRILAERAEGLGVDIRRDTLVRSDADLPESDLVIGADGLRSTVRKWIEPRVRPDYSGATCWYGVTEASGSATSNVTSWVGRSTEAGILPIDDDRVYWYISSIARQRGASKPGDTEVADEAAELAARFDGPLAEYVASTDAITRQPLFYLPTGLPRFAADAAGVPILLVGDAAHAMVPSLVQGANQSFEDAATLRILLDDDPDIETLLAGYNVERVRRAQDMQRKSLRAMHWMQANNPVTGAIRNAVLKLTPTVLAEVAVGWHGRWWSPNAPR